MKFRNLIILIFALSSLGCKANGATWQHYRISAFDEARNRDMTIFLHFFKEGDINCEKQKGELEVILQDTKFSKVGAYRVAWDTEKALQKAFSVKESCTLLVFKGNSLKTRISSDVGSDLLKIALQQGL